MSAAARSYSSGAASRIMTSPVIRGCSVSARLACVPSDRLGTRRYRFDLLTDKLSHLRGRETATGVERREPAADEKIADGRLCQAGSPRLTQIAQHHPEGTDRSDRAGRVPAGYVRRGPVDGLEHRDSARVNIARCGASQSALDGGSEICEDIAE